MSPADARLAARAREIALTLTSWPSVTATPDEAAFSGRLAELIGAHPHFRERPHDLLRLPVPSDPHGRENVLAIVRGEGRRTVLLAGHFDVVPVDDYGDLAPLAFSPERLKPALIERLAASGSNPLALEDLSSVRGVARADRQPRAAGDARRGGPLRRNAGRGRRAP
jgi:arginine utilization protein RocB